MTGYGQLYEVNGRYVLAFQRELSCSAEKAFEVMTTPAYFTKWYPFATGEMELAVGGKLYFDDGEGSQYEGEVLEYERPHTFVFQEVDDLVEMKVTPEKTGSQFTFKHTFDDKKLAQFIAAGWHRCLDAFGQMAEGKEVDWPDNAEELRAYYQKAFK
ncbi:SRPBCC domain-containing protein [Gracilibacillus salinarum]|uniref:SRPBCC domain-containing protein n=1 Tax=Gracilibacillus salinarum TaxID=2932255 RepID=A0ABY4GL03_9BACI|nr:SRPBCC domain-containing protein [Gracilibacillus salinarum]UOQ84909.1 SRPBCC domain-containing protein [Gracilibacillus salinarum]